MTGRSGRAMRSLLFLFLSAALLAQQQEPTPACACSSAEAQAASREGITFHQKRRLDEASESYRRALRAAPPLEPSATEQELILGFAPLLHTDENEPFPLSDVAAILHPNGRWIAYHLFWEDDIDFPDDNDPCDHEVLWVELDESRTRPTGVYTYFHGHILRAPEPTSGRPNIYVQWGKHGSLPAGWQQLTLPRTGSARVSLQEYNHATWRKLHEKGRDRADSPLGRGWPLRYEGTWEDFTRFSRAVDPAALLRQKRYWSVSCLNNAVINRHFLRYNFSSKTEWPEAMCATVR
jgi:hypothetical protein